jgi:hypothetical protein
VELFAGDFHVARRVRFAAAWGTKKRVPESMPTSEALPQTCLIRMGERAGWGASCWMESDKVSF